MLTYFVDLFWSLKYEHEHKKVEKMLHDAEEFKALMLQNQLLLDAQVADTKKAVEEVLKNTAKRA